MLYHHLCAAVHQIAAIFEFVGAFVPHLAPIESSRWYLKGSRVTEVDKQINKHTSTHTHKPTLLRTENNPPHYAIAACVVMIIQQI